MLTVQFRACSNVECLTARICWKHPKFWFRPDLIAPVPFPAGFKYLVPVDHWFSIKNYIMWEKTESIRWNFKFQVFTAPGAFFKLGGLVRFLSLLSSPLELFVYTVSSCRQLRPISELKDLGVTVSSTLSWSLQSPGEQDGNKSTSYCSQCF